MPRPPAKRMSPDELIRGRVALNFTQADLARALYVHPETVYQWETGRRSIPGPVQAWLHIMLRPTSRKRMRRDADLTKAKAKLAELQIGPGERQALDDLGSDASARDRT
jgi:DNA-binding transcriptional regulator YdaS (Cro superfamily)